MSMSNTWIKFISVILKNTLKILNLMALLSSLKYFLLWSIWLIIFLFCFRKNIFWSNGLSFYDHIKYLRNAISGKNNCLKASLNWRCISTWNFKDNNLSCMFKARIFNSSNSFDGNFSWFSTEIHWKWRSNINKKITVVDAVEEKSWNITLMKNFMKAFSELF